MVQTRSGIVTQTLPTLNTNAKPYAEEKKLISPTNTQHNNIQILSYNIVDSTNQCTQQIDIVECKQQHNDAIQHSSTDKYDIFQQWMQQNGAKFPYLTLKQYSNNYRGVHIDLSSVQHNNDIDLTQLCIPKGKTLLHIPYKLLISVELVKSTPLGNLIASQLNGQIGSQALLAMYLLHEKAKGSQSFWYPWLNVMPTDFSNLPMYFDSTTLSLLHNCTDLLNKIKSQQKIMTDEYNLISNIYGINKHITFTYSEFVWACMCVGTRVFSLCIHGIKTSVLAPLADMCNHSNPSGTSWSWDNNRDAFVLNSCKMLYNNDQVYESYGIKCNRRFFASYGFVIEHNIHNEVSIVVEHSNKKHSYSVKANYDTAAEELLQFIRQCNTNKTKLSIETELHMLYTIHDNIQSHLNKYDTTLEHDELLLQQEYLNEPEYTNQRNCIIYRLGEKRVYQYWLNFCNYTITLLTIPITHALQRIQYICEYSNSDTVCTDEFIADAATLNNYTVYLTTVIQSLLNETQLKQRRAQLHALSLKLDSTQITDDIAYSDSERMSISRPNTAQSQPLNDMDISLTESEIMQYIQCDTNTVKHTNTPVQHTHTNVHTTTKITQQSQPTRAQTQPTTKHTVTLPAVQGKQLLKPAIPTPALQLPKLVVVSPTLQPSTHSKRLFDAAQQMNKTHQLPTAVIQTSTSVPKQSRSLLQPPTKVHHIGSLTATAKLLNQRNTEQTM